MELRLGEDTDSNGPSAGGHYSAFVSPSEPSGGNAPAARPVRGFPVGRIVGELDAIVGVGTITRPQHFAAASAAMDAGFDAMKLFPVQQAGGVGMVKALAGPFPAAKFCPTGGIGPANVKDYLSLPNVLCVDGSWVAPKAMMQSGDWAGITSLARAAAALPR